MDKVLSQFIGKYPDEKSELFEYDLARHKEMWDQRSTPGEATPLIQGIGLKHQILRSRYFSNKTPYSAGLIIDGVGTGKTCNAVLIAETHKYLKESGKDRRPAIVLVPNTILQDQFYAQISGQCTPKGTYKPLQTKSETLQAEKGKDVKTKTKNIQRMTEKRLRWDINKYYQIETHTTFLRSIKDFDLETLKKSFSNRVIIIDEIHHLKRKTTDKIDLYAILWRLLHAIDNGVVILLSGTPVWDKTHEIADVMNLILPEGDSQLPTGKRFMKTFFDKKLRLINVDVLRQAFRGKVTYLRKTQSSTVIKDQGVVLKPFLRLFTVYPDILSDYQYSISKYFQDRHQDDDGEQTIFDYKLRNSTTCVFPVENFNKSQDHYNLAVSFSDNVKKKPSVLTYANDYIRREYKTSLAKYSSVFYNIIKRVNSNPDEVVLVYNDFIEGSGGCLNLGLILKEVYGWTWAKTAESLSTKNKTRFIIISDSSYTTSNNDEITQVIRHISKPDNKYGDYCRVIIGGRKILEGITIKNVRQHHNIRFHWNPSALDQANGRDDRLGTHNAFPTDKEKYLNRYTHVSVKRSSSAPKTGGGILSRIDKKYETVDIRVAKIAEDKEYQNSQIARVLKETSFDCGISYRRNVLNTDVDGSRECNYRECNYKCSGWPEDRILKKPGVWEYNIPPSQIITGMYNEYYSSEEVNKYITMLKDYFRKIFNSRFSEIKESFKNSLGSTFSQEIFLKALLYATTNNEIFINKFGIVSYLKEEKNRYFLVDDMNTSRYSDSIYTSAPRLTEFVNLENIIDIDEYTLFLDNLRNDCSLLTNKEYLKTINVNLLIFLVELVLPIPDERIREYITDDVKKFYKRNYGNYITKISDGLYVHNLHSFDYKNNEYIFNTRDSNKLRMFNISNKMWVVVPPEKREEYMTLLKSISNKQFDEYVEKNKSKKYISFNDGDAKFKIMKITGPGEKKRPGSACAEAGFKKVDLIKIFYDMDNLSIISIPDELSNKSRRVLSELIRNCSELSIFYDGLSERSRKDLLRIYTLKSLKNLQICEMLERYFKLEKLYFDKSRTYKIY